MRAKSLHLSALCIKLKLLSVGQTQGEYELMLCFKCKYMELQEIKHFCRLQLGEHSPLTLLHLRNIHWSKTLHYSTRRKQWGATNTALLSKEETCKHTGRWWGCTQHWMLTEYDKPEGGLTGQTRDSAFPNLPYDNPKFISTGAGLPIFSLGLVEKTVSRHLSLLKLLNRASQRDTQESWDDSEISSRIYTLEVTPTHKVGLLSSTQ